MKFNFVTLALLGAVLAALGQVSFKHGADGRHALAEFMNLWILLGFAFYGGGTLLWILALSKVPLTVVYSFAALTYVLVNVLAVALLGERLSMRGLAGTAIVLLGLFLVATSLEVSHGST
jgi:undecaprenyl phosphate-alpha-L-ara4N flippase subunit ArnE